MKKVVVIGGGLAGLSVAVHLAKNKFQVELFEASPKLGGRTYSFIDKITGDEVDNGQHIMMGCYNSTLEFLKITNSLDKISIQKNLEVNFFHPQKGKVRLKTNSFPYPLNLLFAILNFQALSFKEKISVLKFFSSILFLNTYSLKNLSVLDWLKKNGQSENTIKSLWEILAIGTLNCSLEEASADIFASVLKTIFLTGNNSTKIILPKFGLSKVFSEPTEKFLKEKNCKIYLSKSVDKICVNEKRVSSIFVDRKEISDFDFVISAVPKFALEKIIDEKNLPLKEIKYSPILSAHIWLSKNIFENDFTGIIDSPVQWIFNHQKYISIVISNAKNLIEKSNDEIQKIILTEIKKYFPLFEESSVNHFKIIKEKRATFIPNSKLENRPDYKTDLENLILAGDWIDTGLPATIEGAILSGKIATYEIISKKV